MLNQNFLRENPETFAPAESMPFLRDKKSTIEEIENVYKKVEGWVRPTMAYDAFANRKTRQFLQSHEFSRFDEIYFPAANLFEASQFSQALELLSTVLEIYQIPEVSSLNRPPSNGLFGFLFSSNSTTSFPMEAVGKKGDKIRMNADEAGQYFQLKGAILKELSRFHEAIEALEMVLDYGPFVRNETWATPFACLCLCETYLKMDDQNRNPNAIHKANLYLQKAKLWSNFDFEKMFTVRVKTATANLSSRNE